MSESIMTIGEDGVDVEESSGKETGGATLA